MTNREQIIIDGVNVGECKHYERHSFYDCNETCEDNGAIVCTNCEDNPDCYFKQLTRKTQECEDLKLILQQSKDNNKSTMLLLAEKNKECEELKDYARRQENQREIYYKEFLKKARALEEIEEACLNDAYTFADGKQIRYDTLDDILNIINKAKEE